MNSTASLFDSPQSTNQKNTNSLRNSAFSTPIATTYDNLFKDLCKPSTLGVSSMMPVDSIYDVLDEVSVTVEQSVLSSLTVILHNLIWKMNKEPH